MPKRLLESLRELSRPIRDEQLPRLGVHGCRGIRALAVVVALCSPGGLVMLPINLIVGDAWRTLLLAAAILGCSAAAYAASRTSLAARHLQTTYLLLMMVPTVSGALHSWSSPWISETMLPLLVVIPLVVLSFYPLRPLAAALSQVPVLAAIAAGYALLPGGRLEMPAAGVLVGAFALALVGAASSQVQRRRQLELERVKEQLIAAERMTTLGSMSARMAHELKTPIAAVQNAETSVRDTLDELRESIGDARVTEDDLREIAAEIGEDLERIRRGAERAGRFIQSIRSHAAGGARDRESEFAIRERVEGVLDLLAFRLRQSRVVMDLEHLSPDVRLAGVPEKFDQIVTNLITNALEACRDSGVGSTIRIAAAEDGETVRFSVEDDGPGVADEVRDQLFTPMFTTRDAGSGLGLPIARDIAGTCFRGSLELRGPSRFELRCPRAGS